MGNTTSKIKGVIDVQISNADYEVLEDGNKIVIYNVPITGEIVQQYDTMFAYKPADEILKVDVKNVPITFLHPALHLEMMGSDEVAKHTYGFMRKPSLDRKKNYSDKKLYSDLIILGRDKVQQLERKLKDGKGIDVSIGFWCVYDFTPGKFDGKKYDYVQRDIELDHLAVLIDENGFIHEGRAPYKQGFGIGADQKNKKMADDMKGIVDENKALSKELDSVKAEKERLVADNANLKTELQTATDKAQKLEKDNKELSDSLNEYKQKEKDEMDAKRKELSDKYPVNVKLYETASDEAINEAFKAMQDEASKNPKGHISSKMGGNTDAKTELELFELQFGGKRGGKKE